MRFRAIDTFRGLAAVIVILFHIPNSVILSGNQFLANAYVCVDFFFVLSGFVISHSYLSRMNDTKSFKAFVKNRFTRIYPLHIFTLLLFLAFESSRYVVNEYFLPLNTPAFKDCTLSSFIGNLTLTHSMGFFNYLSWNIPSWSISVEFYVYLFWAICLLIFRKRLFLIGAVTFPFIIWFIISHNGNIEYTYNYGFIRCLYGFLIGMYTHILSKKMKQLSFGISTYLEVLALVLTVVIFYSVTPTLNWLTPLWFSAFIIIFSKESGFTSRLLAHSRLRFLGELSYSYYLTHAVIIRALDLFVYKVMKMQHSILVDGSFILIVLLSTHLLALLTHKYVELAFYKKKTKNAEKEAQLAVA